MSTYDEKIDKICEVLGVRLLGYQRMILKSYLSKEPTPDRLVLNTTTCYGKTLMFCLRALLSPNVKPFTIEEFDKVNHSDGLSGYITTLNRRLRKAGIVTNLITN